VKQLTLFQTLEAPRQIVAEWVCAKCGLTGAVPLASRPPLDDRYALGYCDSWIDIFDREAWQERRDREDLATLVRQFADDRARQVMTLASLDRMMALFDKWGLPGFFPTDTAREQVMRYRATEAAKKVDQSRRKAGGRHGA